jgi:LPXTG-site transpeptidase (sortase) family protein
MSSVKTRAPKKYMSFIPPLLGMLPVAFVLGASHLQQLSKEVSYNLSQSPSKVAAADAAYNSQNTTPNDVSQITINKIKVQAPVLYDAQEENEATFQELLKNGVVHYPNTALPGQVGGNVAIFGHSSGAAWAPGNYKFVFSMIDKLEQNDKIYIDYQGKRYAYAVINKRVVLPNEVSVLYHTGKSQLTLVTCYPVGTNEKRLVVSAVPVASLSQKSSINPGKAWTVPSAVSDRALQMWDIAQGTL